MKGSVIALWGLVGAVALSPPGNAQQQTCPFTTNGVILVGDTVQVGALVPSGVPDTCLATAPCVAQGTQPVHYDVYTLANNNTASPTCVTAKLTALCGVPGVTEMYLAAYSPAFNPSSICQNYVGSSGMTAVNSQVGVSFQVPPGAQFQVVISLPVGSQCEYRLTVNGCGLGDPQPPQPVPALSPAGLAALLLGLALCGLQRLRRNSAGRG